MASVSFGNKYLPFSNWQQVILFVFSRMELEKDQHSTSHRLLPLVWVIECLGRIYLCGFCGMNMLGIVTKLHVVIHVINGFTRPSDFLYAFYGAKPFR